MMIVPFEHDSEPTNEGKPEVQLTPAMILKYVPFSQKPEQFRQYLDLTRKILKELSNENMCNYMQLTSVEAKFSLHLLETLIEGEKLYKLLYESGFSEKLQGEWVEEELRLLSEFTTDSELTSDTEES